MRSWFRLALLLAILVIALETFLVLGIVTPVAIQGSSMAPTMLGPHVQVACPRCEFDFPVGGDQLPGAWPMVCPDCGHEFHGPKLVQLRPGRRVWVDRTRFLRQSPRRHDIVVFRCPDNPTSLCVKRIVGLPSETVDFVRGDLLINGKVSRKSLGKQLELRQLVHREREALRLWRSGNDAWDWHNGKWRHNAEEESRLLFTPPDGMVTDDFGVNQRSSRVLNPVSDLMVTCQVDIDGESDLKFIATFPDGTRQLADLQLASPIAPPRRARRVEIVWSLFDQQILLAVDGKVKSREKSNKPWPGPPQITISASGAITLQNLTVWRDVYRHVRPIDRWPAEGVTLPEQEFFVAGDNVAISSDSRNWIPRGLPQRLLLGAPVRSP